MSNIESKESTRPLSDLAIEPWYPSFVRTLDTLLSEMMVEEIVVANEFHQNNHERFQGIMDVFRSHGMEPIVSEVAHEKLKQLARDSEVAVRTGECTRYANAILSSSLALFTGHSASVASFVVQPCLRLGLERAVQTVFTKKDEFSNEMNLWLTVPNLAVVRLSSHRTRWNGRQWQTGDFYDEGRCETRPLATGSPSANPLAPTA